ncbi:hypothetical protein FB451DRAFT_1249429 [Mycena latifolia]|nr:hypothetical protein FB451DRAFT_1249429 [Mycena latifolia]
MNKIQALSLAQACTRQVGAQACTRRVRTWAHARGEWGHGRREPGRGRGRGRGRGGCERRGSRRGRDGGRAERARTRVRTCGERGVQAGGQSELGCGCGRGGSSRGRDGGRGERGCERAAREYYLELSTGLQIGGSQTHEGGDSCLLSESNARGFQRWPIWVAKCSGGTRRKGRGGGRGSGAAWPPLPASCQTRSIQVTVATSRWTILNRA